jgi:chromosome segregation ATPase
MSVLLAWPLLILGICSTLHLEGAFHQRGYVDSEQRIAWNETRDKVDSLSYQMENQETELHTLEQKLENLTTILESLKEHIENSATLQSEQLQGRTHPLETKMLSLEGAVKTLSSDLKRLQTHANETSSALEIFQKKFSDWDLRLQNQNQNMENLQAAVQTMMEALQMKMEGASITGWTGKTHKVKNGDSLEKIARTYKTSVRAIREINEMSSDKIIIGKTLKIPS